jgi:hypothetical protein
MGREEEVRMIAYGLRMRDGNKPRRFLERWLEAEAIWEYNHKGITPLEDEPNRLLIVKNDHREDKDLAAC